MARDPNPTPVMSLNERLAYHLGRSTKTPSLFPSLR